MDAMNFLNGIFQMSAIHDLALVLGKCELAFDDLDTLTDPDFPQEGTDAYWKAHKADENPGVAHHPEHGWFVLHDFGEEKERLVCWAEMGPGPFSKLAGKLWAAKTDSPMLRDLGVDGSSWRAVNPAEVTLTEMTLRKLQKSDLGPYLRDNLTIDTDSDMKGMLDSELSDQNRVGFATIAWFQKSPVGWGLLYFNTRSKKGYGDVFVRGDARRKGLGTRIAKEIMTVADREGREHLIVDDDPVWRALLDGAGFFEKDGHKLMDYTMPEST